MKRVYNDISTLSRLKWFLSQVIYMLTIQIKNQSIIYFLVFTGKLEFQTRVDRLEIQCIGNHLRGSNSRFERKKNCENYVRSTFAEELLVNDVGRCSSLILDCTRLFFNEWVRDFYQRCACEKGCLVIKMVWCVHMSLGWWTMWTRRYHSHTSNNTENKKETIVIGTVFLNFLIKPREPIRSCLFINCVAFIKSDFLSDLGHDLKGTSTTWDARPITVYTKLETCYSIVFILKALSRLLPMCFGDFPPINRKLDAGQKKLLKMHSLQSFPSIR